MPRRATVIDEMLDETVDRKVEKKLEDMFSENEDSEITQQIKEEDIKEEHEKKLELDKAIKSTLADSYHYCKLYKIDFLNPKRPVFLEYLQDLTSIEDLETFIQQLAIQRGWSNGLYKLAFFLKNPKNQFESGMRKQLEFNISVPEKINKEIKSNSPLQSVRESAELIKTVRDAIGANNQPQINSSDPKLIADTFKMGVDAIRNNLPTEKSQNVLEIITALMPIITSLLQKPKEPSLIEQIAALKQAGMIPDQQKENSLSNKIVEVALAKLLEGSGGEAPSMGVEIVRQLAPAVPGMIDRITGTINNVLQYKSPEGAVKVSQEKPQQLPINNIPPIFNELFTAAGNKNYDYFPKLVHGIGYWLENGDQYLTSIITEEINQEMITVMLVHYGGEQFDSDIMKDYINKFIDWYKQQYKQLLPSEEKKSKIIYIAKCEKCEEEYEFETKEEIKDERCIVTKEEDGKKIVCDGELKFIKEEEING